jgi:hypothetical protein
MISLLRQIKNVQVIKQKLCSTLKTEHIKLILSKILQEHQVLNDVLPRNQVFWLNMSTLQHNEDGRRWWLRTEQSADHNEDGRLWWLETELSADHNEDGRLWWFRTEQSADHNEDGQLWWLKTELSAGLN